MHDPANDSTVLASLLELQDGDSAAQAPHEIAARAGLSTRDSDDALTALAKQGLVQAYDAFRSDGSTLRGWGILDRGAARTAINRAELSATIQIGPRKRLSGLATDRQAF